MGAGLRGQRRGRQRPDVAVPGVVLPRFRLGIDRISIFCGNSSHGRVVPGRHGRHFPDLPADFDLYRADNEVEGGAYFAPFDAWLVPRRCGEER
ncbi:uncharacterized protein SOCE836_028100 [Sorangium cellulosum]|uniref:Uncharacterized protein n=1 Tax=Sorangium cellulosum TaxID=56 RepID=A0A4P2QKY8_SORCE|nr:uncharacterized protein SOCE836_028100 [Sorangium cellulosum]